MLPSEPKQEKITSRGVAGIVLCGGRSRRMGRPKAWLTLGSEFFLQRITRILGQVVDPVVVVAAEGQDLPKLPERILVVRDRFADRGPLQGLATGLEALEKEVEFVYLSGTDAPLINVSHVHHLIDQIGEADMIVPEAGGFLHPLSALYRRRTVVPEVGRLLDEGQGRLLDLIDRVRVIRVGSTALIDCDPSLSTLRNVNTSEEYEALLRDLGSLS